MSTSPGEAHPLIARIAAHTPMDPKEIERFIKFATVGAFGAVVDFALLNFLALGLGWPDLLANTVSFTVAVISNFTWNRFWTFPETRNIRKRNQLPQFAVVSVIGLAINTVVLYFTKLILVNQGVGDAIALNIAKAFAILVVLFWNFGANRLWTYRDV
ncbi:MAG: GtrA family protein [Proteobacteria bacterium]|nr:GtrA family protein [Pseudomonadota bacterium]